MKSKAVLLIVVLILSMAAARAAISVGTPTPATPVEKLAAREIQRYLYLRTGHVPGLTPPGASGQRIIAVNKTHAAAVAPSLKNETSKLGPQEYIIKTLAGKGGKTWYIVGGDDPAVLYGAYRFIEKLGVRFYLHGDVVPSAKLKSIPDINETGKPIFSIRGIQPFHDFTEGPDWWNRDDYLAYISQLPKMRMNFIGIHCYPEPIAEPSVWIGLPEDMDGNGRVKFSYPSNWANTALDGNWGYAAVPTSSYSMGASLLFPSDKYGPDVMGNYLPKPASPEDYNAVFNNAADLFNAAFGHARSLGVKTCIGTETPITIPALVAEHLKAQGKDPADHGVVREIYRGIFSRIQRAYPVDYYWLWTPEGWTWSGNTKEQLDNTLKDIESALGALDDLGNPFALATCGWVLGPANDRTLLDNILPKTSPMSCINRHVGHAPVEPEFANLKNRPKWAIPWMENDPNLVAPQPWVGRMRYDAADAKSLGCTGLLGIHWRAKMMCQNVAALAAAGWDQSWAKDNFDAVKASYVVKLGPVNGRIVSFTAPVADTEQDEVYRSVRFDVDAYRLKVPNGVYTVTLKFNEPHYTEPGKRVFGVKIQNRTVLEHLDIFARVGQNRALDFSYPDIRVNDELLKISFDREVELPCIAGIVIKGHTDSNENYTRKINCGGPAVDNFESDLSEPTDKIDKRFLPCGEFYVDFCRAGFGEDVAVAAGEIMEKIDGRNLHEPSGWINGPGGIIPNREAWESVKKRYVFVDEFAALRSRVKDPADRERFDYWLNTYKYMRVMAEAGCVRGAIDVKIDALKAEGDKEKQRALAQEALDLRIKLSRLWENMIALQIAAVDTPGEMGTIDNLERHTRVREKFLTLHDEIISQTLGKPLPESLMLSVAYNAPPRITVPTVRTQVKPNETLKLRVLILSSDPVKNATAKVRPMGRGEFKAIPLEHISRGVYQVTLPAAKEAYEYYLTAATGTSKLVWPASAPRQCQTVIVW